MTKTSITDLAEFGGTPEFDQPRHVGTPNTGDREDLFERLNGVLDRRWLSNGGECVREFEQRVAALSGVKHCIATCNGTVALEIAIRGLGLTGEVIVPSFTFVATAHALQWQEITPIFCDIKPGTYNIDADALERLITPRTSGILGVHLWSRPCDIERMETIADKHHLKIIYDASHAFGCSYRGEMIGSFGDAEVFSFHATKFVNCCEGGAVVTNNDDLAAKVRLMKNFGFRSYDDVIHLGTNGKMSEFSAAMGLTNLDAMDWFIARNRENYEIYNSVLSNVPGLNVVQYGSDERQNYQYIVVKVDESLCNVSVDHLIRVLHAENILARRYFYPGCHRMEPYRSYFPNAGLLLPETERISSRVISLPTGTAVSTDDVGRIAEIVEFVCSNGTTVSSRCQ